MRQKINKQNSSGTPAFKSQRQSMIDLKGNLNFDQTHCKIIKVTISFSEFVSSWKKSTQLIYSFLRYSRF